MSSKTNSKKIKIIQFKDVVSILIILVILSFSVSGVIGSVQGAYNDEAVITRDLAMFASLAYADLENIKDYTVTVDSNMNDIPKINLLTKITENDLTFAETPIVSDSLLKTIKTKTSILGIPKKSDENTYDYLFYGLASTEEVADWQLVNYTKFNTTILKGNAVFTAMTFKRDNDIVIAYRGTDFDDWGDWAQDLFYGIVGYAGQESVAQDYAKVVAKHYKNLDEDINIYITGHSLGGYLAQIGGAALVAEKEFKDNVKEIGYFNGMGLKFWSNISSKINTSIANRLGIKISKINELKKSTSSINRVQDTAKQALTNWKNNGGKIVSYNINGDVVSSLGTHVGEKVYYNAHTICVNHHNGNKAYIDLISTTAFKLIKQILNKDISSYVELYKPQDIIDFVWMTHETDSFFGVLPYADGTMPLNLDVKIDMPTTIKYNKKATATLTITTTGISLSTTTLNKNNFSSSSTRRLKIDSISKPTITETEDGYKYTYKITLKGGIVVGYSNISLKANVLKLQTKTRTMANNIINLLTRNIFTSENIITKLR